MRKHKASAGTNTETMQNASKIGFYGVRVEIYHLSIENRFWGRFFLKFYAERETLMHAGNFKNVQIY